jgi:hypothetical protein
MRCLDAFADAVDGLTRHITPAALTEYVEAAGWVYEGIALNGHGRKWTLGGAVAGGEAKAVVIPAPSYVCKDRVVRMRQAIIDVLEAEGWGLAVRVELEIPKGLRGEG